MISGISNARDLNGGNAGRYYWLDWLRFGAAFVVLVGHVRGEHFVDYGDLDPKDHSFFVAMAFMLSRLGQESVLLFFVLSGFLVGGRSTRKALDDSFRVWPYASDRLTRIYVPLVPALLLTAAVLVFRGGHVSCLSLLGNLGGLQGIFCENFGGNAPLWSLAYEVWFYILWGSVLTLLVSASVKTRFSAWLAMLAGLAVFTKLQAVYLFCWLLGALTCLIKPKMPRSLGLISGLLLVLLGVILCQLTSDSASFGIKGIQPFLPSRPVCLLLLSLGFTLLVSTVAVWAPESRWCRKIEECGTPLAAFSYTMYLTHFAIIGVWEAFFPGRAKGLDFKSLSTFLLELLFCLTSAWIMYFFFEKRTASVRRWLNMHFSNHANNQFKKSSGESPTPTPAAIMKKFQ